MHFWNALSKTQVLANIKAIHSLVGSKVIEVIREARNLAGNN